MDKSDETIRQRLTGLLFFGQSIGSAAFIAGSTVSALVGAQLNGTAWLAGLPGAVHLAGSALAAYPAARLMERLGRRPGLVFGFSLGLVGALTAGGAVLAGSFAAFLLGVALMGTARGFTDMGRYAAAEMHPAAARGRAISLVVLGGTLGAVLGPGLVGPTGDLARAAGAEALAGPWFASAVLFSLGALAMSLWLRPDPRDLARQIGQPDADTGAAPPAGRAWRDLLRLLPVQTALSALVLGQVVMVMLMAMTSLHMQGHQHSLFEISLVISAHTLGMFGPSVISGRLVDRWGRAPMIGLGAGLLVLACLLAPLSPATLPIGVALFLLGLGWNFTYVAGGTLLTDVLTSGERARGQGVADLLINLASASGSLGSGVLFAGLGYALISWIGLLLALIPLALAVAMLVRRAGRAATLD